MVDEAYLGVETSNLFLCQSHKVQCRPLPTKEQMMLLPCALGGPDDVFEAGTKFEPQTSLKPPRHGTLKPVVIFDAY